MKNNQKREAQPTPNSVSAIRDIIFGEQMVDYDSRFADLEKALTAEISRVEKKLDKGIADITALLNKKNDSLAEGKVDRIQLANMLQKVVDSL